MNGGSEAFELPERRHGETAVEAVLRWFEIPDLTLVRYGTPLYETVARAREIDVREREALHQRRQRIETFDFKLWPELYRDTDVERLPGAAERVLGYSYGERGLLAHGETGRG